MNPLRLLQRPEYLLRPGQVWRRMRRDAILERDAVCLAWGLPVTVDQASHIGGDILNLGVADRIVPEVLYRLLDAGELGVDAGAHVGQNCSIMALAATPRGRVLAFEPSPNALRLLTRNVERWRGYQLAPIAIEPRGLSCRAGSVTMYPSDDPGGFSLEVLTSPAVRGGFRRPDDVESSFQVEVTRLDACLPDDATIGVLKIDVEGHEASVLEGAGRLLAEGRIRDVVFEDYEPQPSHVVRMLQSLGYAVFAIVSSWGGPRVLDLDEWARTHGEQPPNFAATLQPARARARLGPIGWQCLRARVRRRDSTRES